MYLTGFPQPNVLAVLDAGRNPRKPDLRLRPREKIQPLLYRLPDAHRNRANVPLSNVNQAGHLSGDVCFFQLSFRGVFLFFSRPKITDEAAISFPRDRAESPAGRRWNWNCAPAGQSRRPSTHRTPLRGRSHPPEPPHLAPPTLKTTPPGSLQPCARGPPK